MQPKAQVTTLAKKVTSAATAAATRHHPKPFRNFPKVPSTQYLEINKLSRDILYSGYRPVMYPLRENPLFFRNGYPQGQNITDVSDFRVVRCDNNNNNNVEPSAVSNTKTSNKTGLDTDTQIKSLRLSGKSIGVSRDRYSDIDNAAADGEQVENDVVVRNDLVFGKDGLGGIATCGATGVWKNEPTTRLKSELQRSSSVWNGSSLRMELYREWRGVPDGVVQRLRPFDDGESGKR